MIDVAEGARVARTDQDVQRDTYGSTKLDRVRWPAVVAGLFGTLSMLAFLTVLGAAIGLSVTDTRSEAENIGIGAGIWGVLATVIAFAFGGWIAAGTAATRGTNNALIQGATVWMVTIGLLVFFVARGAGTLLTSASNAASGAITQAIDNDTNNNRVNTDTAAPPRVNVNRADVETARERGAAGAWSMVLAMLLGLGAALGGSYFGRRNRDAHASDDYRDVALRRGDTAGLSDVRR